MSSADGRIRQIYALEFQSDSKLPVDEVCGAGEGGTLCEIPQVAARCRPSCLHMSSCIRDVMVTASGKHQTHTHTQTCLDASGTLEAVNLTQTVDYTHLINHPECVCVALFIQDVAQSALCNREQGLKSDSASDDPGHVYRLLLVHACAGLFRLNRFFFFLSGCSWNSTGLLPDHIHQLSRSIYHCMIESNVSACHILSDETVAEEEVRLGSRSDAAGAAGFSSLFISNRCHPAFITSLWSSWYEAKLSTSRLWLIFQLMLEKLRRSGTMEASSRGQTLTPLVLQPTTTSAAAQQ